MKYLKGGKVPSKRLPKATLDQFVLSRIFAVNICCSDVTNTSPVAPVLPQTVLAVNSQLLVNTT